MKVHFQIFGDSLFHLERPVAGEGMDVVNPSGITKKKGGLKMKACFRFFKAPFFFVGWLAPANGLTHCFYTLLTQPGPFKLRFQNRKVTGRYSGVRTL